MRLFRPRRLGVLLCLVLLMGGVASAQPFTFYFEGTVDYIHDYLELDESVYVGAPFSGGYTFDPTGVTDEDPEDPLRGAYYFGPAGRMWAQIGNYEFVTDTLGMLIWDDRPDLYQVGSFSVSDVGGYQWQFMNIALADETRTALDSDALITTLPDWDAFADFRGLLIDLPGDDLGIRGILTSLTPEPSSLVLFGLGGVVLCRRRNR